MLKKIIKEPLVQFFLVGGILFAIFQWQNPPEPDSSSNTIVIDRAVINNLIRTQGDQGSEEELNSLVRDFVEEEALYREALELGLDRGDFIIKRRLIQKLSFILEDLSTQSVEVNDEQLEKYYKDHKESFRPPPKLTFGHVYISQDRLGDKAMEEAKRLQKVLNDKRLGINQVQKFGDRFPLKPLYGDISPQGVSAHFGDEFASTLFKLPAIEKWQGPVRSGYGVHLVYVSKKTLPKTPTFEAVKAKIVQSYVYEQKSKLNNQARKRIVEKYKIVRKDTP